MELNKIICGDALEELRKMPNESVDLIFTSPPYNLGNTHHTGSKKHKAYDDNLPEWEYRNMGNIQATANSHYKTMKQEDIEALPIKELADDNAILFLWATFPKLQEALNVIKAWGFEYKTVGFTWVKKNKGGGNFFGVGWYTKSNAEICLIGVKGKAPKASNSVSSIIESVPEGHSAKPMSVREKIVEFCGDLSRIELFARPNPQNTLDGKNTFDGWDVWGNEVISDITF